MTRRRLPDRRRVETHAVKFMNAEFKIGVGYHNDGTMAEVWCDPPPGMSGSYVDFLAKDAATVVSVALQWGVPLDEMSKSIARVPGANGDEPATLLGAILDTLATAPKPGPMPKGWKPAKWKPREVQTAGKGA